MIQLGGGQLLGRCLIFKNAVINLGTKYFLAKNEFKGGTLGESAMKKRRLGGPGRPQT